MRQKTVEVKMINGDLWYLHSSEFNTFDVPEAPEAIISSYIRGSKGPLIKANNQKDFSGESRLINANFIIDMKVTYDDNPVE